MSILGAVIVPHPPLIIPTVGRGREQEVQATIDAYRTATKQVAAWNPEVLIITSPHQVMYADYFHISPGRGATGDMSAFGAAQTKLRVEYDAPLRDEIIRCGEAVGLQVGTLGQRDPYLDHGTFVPLYFLREAGVDCPILRIGLSGFSPLDHYRLGQCIAQAVEGLGRRAVFIASGDLSHKLRDDGPYGFAREGPEFDRQVTEANIRIMEALKGYHVLADMCEFGEHVIYSDEEVAAMGFKIVTHPLSAAFYVSKQMKAFYDEYYKTGTTLGLYKDMNSREEWEDVVGMQFWSTLKNNIPD